MEISKVKLFDAFGELVYAVAMADGLIQAEETDALKKILLGHPWAKDIQWSFDYENKKHKSVEEAYASAIDIFKEYGPSAEYAFLTEVLAAVALACQGKDAEETAVIDNFKTDLTQRFIKDLEQHGLHYFD